MKSINIYLSENSVIDGQENTLSLINIFDDISAPNYPLFFPKLSITCVFEKEPEDVADIECFIICRLNEVEIQRFPFKVSFRGTFRARSIIKINGFLIPSPGNLDFDLELNGEVLNKTRLIARLIEKPTIEQK